LDESYATPIGHNPTLIFANTILLGLFLIGGMSEFVMDIFPELSPEEIDFYGSDLYALNGNPEIKKRNTVEIAIIIINSLFYTWSNSPKHI